MTARKKPPRKAAKTSGKQASDKHPKAGAKQPAREAKKRSARKTKKKPGASRTRAKSTPKRAAMASARRRASAADRKPGTGGLVDRVALGRFLPVDLAELLPVDALRRIGEVGLIEFLSEYVRERAEGVSGVQRDPAFLEEYLPIMRHVLRYFDAEVAGFEKLPDRGPMLLVGNHSGGTLIPDTSVFVASWYRERGLDSPLVMLALDAVFGVPGYGDAARRGGAVPANPENAHRALQQGAALLVYPGGDHEAYRPWTDRNRIDFDGRKGFIKLALRERVPVVPVVGHGGHESVVVLARGDSLSRVTGFDRLRTSVMPMVWQLPWGISLPFVPGLPMPVKISMQIGSPLDWSHHGPDEADDPAVLDRCYDEITGVMQGILDRLAAEHPHPLAERLWGLVPGGDG